MNELNTTTSDYAVSETVNRMISAIEEEGGHIFAWIDHAKEVREKVLDLRPTELTLFSNLEVGTKLMQDRQTSAIDLPMKALVWKDEKGQIRIACNSMEWLKERHGLTDEETVKSIADVTQTVCSVATNA